MRIDWAIYITKGQLTKLRGWTPALFALLPLPDHIATNAYKTQISLWRIKTIEAIERGEKFKGMLPEATKRKSASKKGVKKQRDNITAYINTLEIEVPVMSMDELFQRACTSYNQRKKDIQARHFDHGDYGFEYEEATPESDLVFLKRISLNYLRHRCTKYEAELDKLFGKVGKEAAYELLKQRINKAITDKYALLL